MFTLLEPVLADEVETIGTKGWSAIEMPLKFLSATIAAF